MYQTIQDILSDIPVKFPDNDNRDIDEQVVRTFFADVFDFFFVNTSVYGSQVVVGDADYVVQATDYLIITGALTADRELVLPVAPRRGRHLKVFVEAGAFSWSTVPGFFDGQVVADVLKPGGQELIWDVQNERWLWMGAVAAMASPGVMQSAEMENYL
jgi:hypothetical protein